jgi:glycolate oxidase FAD binding subunit
MDAVAQDLEQLVGTAGLRAWNSVDVAQQQVMLRALIPGVQPKYVVYPQTQEELAAVMRLAHHQRWRVLPFGHGSKLHWGGLAEDITLAVSTQHLNRVIEHAIGDLTVTAEAGLSFAELQQMLNNVGQFLAIDPSYCGSCEGELSPNRATLGGIVATGDTGSIRHRYNSVRDMLLGITFVRSDGQLVKAGGRVVKNVAGYDLMKLLTGSYGTLGIITQVTFRVYPLPQASQTVVITGEAAAIAQAIQALLSSALTPTAVDLRLDQGLCLVVRFQSVSESVALQTTRLNELASALGLVTKLYTDDTERDLWKEFKYSMGEALQDNTSNGADRQGIVCKIGVKPSHAVEALCKMETLMPNALAVIHAGSGLGQLQMEERGIEDLEAARSLLQSLGGYLSILQAPPELKQSIDIWGYPGNALPLMKRVKQHFDPEHLLSPHRFVGGI